MLVRPLALARAGRRAFFKRIFLLRLCAAAARMMASVKSVGLRSTLANSLEIHCAMLGRGAFLWGHCAKFQRLPRTHGLSCVPLYMCIAGVHD